MECTAYISHSSSLPGSSLYLNSDLNLIQREPLNYKEINTEYNVCFYISSIIILNDNLLIINNL